MNGVIRKGPCPCIFARICRVLSHTSSLSSGYAWCDLSTVQTPDVTASPPGLFTQTDYYFYTVIVGETPVLLFRLLVCIDTDAISQFPVADVKRSEQINVRGSSITFILQLVHTGANKSTLFGNSSSPATEPTLPTTDPRNTHHL